MHMPTIAAIDVGTNAMRLAIGSINEDHRIELLENIREPVRLGKDVFAGGTISEETTERAIEAFQKFRRLIDKYGVEHLKAVATSATREALNSDIFIDRIAQATGIEIVAQEWHPFGEKDFFPVLTNLQGVPESGFFQAVMSDVVDNSNAAVAYASCTDCTAVAIAFEIVVIWSGCSLFPCARG